LEEALHEKRNPQCSGIPPGCRTSALHFSDAGRKTLGRVEGLGLTVTAGVPRVGKLKSAAQRRQALSADTQRTVGLLYGLGVKEYVGELYVLATIGGLVLGPQFLERGQVLVRQPTTILKRNSQKLELLPHPASAGADDESTLGEHVDGG